MTGTYLKYKDRRFATADLDVVRMADTIVTEYEDAGMAMTLRQLYYQFVSRDLLPNVQESYDRLKTLVSDGRMAGLISWTGIEDRTRNLKGRETYNSPADVLRIARESYHTDRWRTQPMRPEVWIEKEALAGVIEPICFDESVDFFACRGYNSQSEQWRAGRRFAGYVRAGQRPVVLHLGDHDAWGLNMTEDNRKRLELFAGVPVLVVRLALNRDQIDRHRPPPNPAKTNSALGRSYVAEHGTESWELDALNPTILRDLVTGAITRYRDPKLWDEALRAEAADKETLDDFLTQLGDQHEDGE